MITSPDDLIADTKRRPGTHRILAVFLQAKIQSAETAKQVFGDASTSGSRAGWVKPVVSKAFLVDGTLTFESMRTQADRENSTWGLVVLAPAYAATRADSRRFLSDLEKKVTSGQPHNFTMFDRDGKPQALTASQTINAPGRTH
jgi:hypothetical protein